MSDASSHLHSSPNVSNVDHDQLNEQLRTLAAQHNLSIDEVRARAAIIVALMTSEPAPSQSSPREAAPFQQSASTNATAPLAAERDANLLVPPGPSNAPAPADPSNAPTESAPANPLAGASSPPRLFETLVMAQIHNLNADMTALNSRMDLMNNRITALDASFNQLNATYLARAPDGRQDNQPNRDQWGRDLSGGADTRTQAEKELVNQL